MNEALMKRIVDNATAVVDQAHNQMLTNPRSMDSRFLLTVLSSVMYDVRNGNEDLRPVMNAGLKEYSIRRRSSQAAKRKLLNR